MPSVVLLLNNCTDATAAIVRDLARRLPIALHRVEVTLPTFKANAGTARALAMEHAAAMAAPDGVLLTTDADSVVPRHWLQANLACIRAGADAVAGRAVIDPEEALLIPKTLHEADARECAYAAVLDEIASLLDPDPGDPWPRHSEASGASIAVTMRAWSVTGGMRPIPLGEDRAFVDALYAHDLRVRHAPEVWVTVSGRIHGRAEGGMADTIRRRLMRPDPFLDDRLEPVTAAANRCWLRRRARDLHESGVSTDRLATLIGVPSGQLKRLLREQCFGKAWAHIERESAVLLRRRVRVEGLACEMDRAVALRDQLRDHLDSTSPRRAAPWEYGAIFHPLSAGERRLRRSAKHHGDHTSLPECGSHASKAGAGSTTGNSTG